MDIETLIIKTKKEIFSKSGGQFSSNILGEGYDFYELREYDYSSDAKKIDWLISAKMQKPYIKVNQEEKARNIVVVFLLSGSLYFGSKRLKIDTLLEAFLLIGFSAVKNREIFTFIKYKEEKEKIDFLKNIYEVEKLSKDLQKENIIGIKPDFKEIDRLFYKLKEKSLVIFLGDFLYDIDLALFSKKHEVLAFVARDSFENKKDLSIDCEIVDNESLKDMSIAFNRKNIKKYRENIEKILNKNFMKFRENGIDYLEIYDYDNIFLKMQKFFIGR